jgi:hypothetical protein
LGILAATRDVVRNPKAIVARLDRAQRFDGNWGVRLLGEPVELRDSFRREDGQHCVRLHRELGAHRELESRSPTLWSSA